MKETVRNNFVLEHRQASSSAMKDVPDSLRGLQGWLGGKVIAGTHGTTSYQDWLPSSHWCSILHQGASEDLVTPRKILLHLRAQGLVLSTLPNSFLGGCHGLVLLQARKPKEKWWLLKGRWHGEGKLG